jgi:calcineurin-like phosphoesterase family protein
MSAVYYTSDTHFLHAMVAEKRGFKDSATHDAEMIQRINDTCRADDVLWLLGDVGMGRTGEILELIHQLQPRINLVIGNHDAPWPGNRNAHTFYRTWGACFNSIQFAASRRINGIKVLLSHMPYCGDHTEVDRHTEWRLQDTGKPNIHGHVHDAWTVRLSPLGTPMINVGVDKWITPVSEEAIGMLLADPHDFLDVSPSLST